MVTIPFAEYLENASALDRAAAEIEQPNLKALLVAQAEAYRQLRQERMNWANSAGKERGPAPGQSVKSLALKEIKDRRSDKLEEPQAPVAQEGE
jgi:hypothetical protein